MPQTRPALKRIIVFARNAAGIPAWSIVAPPEARTLAAQGDVITPEEVVAWFKQAAPNWQNPDPTTSALGTLVSALNLVRVTVESGIRQQDGGARAMKLAAANKAVEALNAALPELIEGASAHRKSMLDAGRMPLMSADDLAALVVSHRVV